MDGGQNVFGAYQERSRRTILIVESLQACPSGDERHTGYTSLAPALLRIQMEQGGRRMKVAGASERNARISTAGPIPYVAIHRQFFEPAFLLDSLGILLPAPVGRTRR